jgi:hypothetical protein
MITPGGGAMAEGGGGDSEKAAIIGGIFTVIAAIIGGYFLTTTSGNGNNDHFSPGPSQVDQVATGTPSPSTSPVGVTRSQAGQPPTSNPTTLSSLASQNGWDSTNSYIVSMTGGPVSLSRNPNNATDLIFDSAYNTFDTQNSARFVGGIDPKPMPTAKECQDHRANFQRYIGLPPDFPNNGYFCILDSEGDLLLVEKTVQSNGFVFVVWQPR